MVKFAKPSGKVAAEVPTDLDLDLGAPEGGAPETPKDEPVKAKTKGKSKDKVKAEKANKAPSFTAQDGIELFGGVAGKRPLKVGEVSLDGLRLPDNMPGRLPESYTSADADDMATSLGLHGQINPIQVTEDGQVLVGWRRVLGARKLGWTKIAAVVWGELGAAESAVLGYAENADRRELNPIAQAQAFRAMLDGGVASSQNKLAKALGVSPAHMSKRLALLDLDPEVQAQVASGEIPVTAALNLSDDPAAMPDSEDDTKPAKGEDKPAKGEDKPDGKSKMDRFTNPDGPGAGRRPKRLDLVEDVDPALKNLLSGDIGVEALKREIGDTSAFVVRVSVEIPVQPSEIPDTDLLGRLLEVVQDKSEGLASSKARKALLTALVTAAKAMKIE